jgi:hypothetical protein
MSTTTYSLLNIKGIHLKITILLNNDVLMLTLFLLIVIVQYTWDMPHFPSISMLFYVFAPLHLQSWFTHMHISHSYEGCQPFHEGYEQDMSRIWAIRVIYANPWASQLYRCILITCPFLFITVVGIWDECPVPS